MSISTRFGLERFTRQPQECDAATQLWAYAPDAATSKLGGRRRVTLAAVALAALAGMCAALALSAPGALAFEGQLDPTFGNNGLVLRPTGISSGAPEVYAPAIGNAAETAALSGGGFPVLRLTILAADGRTVVADNLGASSATVEDVAPVALVPMPDGLYMAVGRQVASNDSNQIVLARFNANGTPDVSFGLQLVPETQCPGHPGGPGFGNIAQAAAFNDNTLLVVGNCGSGAGLGEQPAVWEFNEQGQLLSTDTLTTFTQNSLPTGFTKESQFTATAIAPSPGGSDYIAGDFEGTFSNGQDQDRIFLAKFRQATGFVHSFGDQNIGYEVYGLGAANTHFFNGVDAATAVTTDVEGLPVVAGYSQGTDGGAFAIARFSTTGAPDKSFGDDSQLVIPIGTPSSSTIAEANAVAVRSDGKIWLSGTVLNDGTVNGLAVVRLGPLGQLDDTFGLNDNGQEVYAVPSGQFASGPGALFIQSNGFPVIAADGDLLSGGSPEFLLARLGSAVCTLCGTTTVTSAPTSVTFTIEHEAGVLRWGSWWSAASTASSYRSAGSHSGANGSGACG
jgi:uncharacterized delta-60 repeat protein